MRDYEDVLKQAKTCANRKYCSIGGNCEYYDLDVCCQDGEKDILKDAADAIEELLDELTTIRKQLPHWISVEERLPEKSKIVLVAYDNGVVAQGMLFFGKFRGANFGFDENDEPIIAEVTHWMPLPAPPKGVE